MGIVGTGLSVDGINYFKDVLQGNTKLECMEFSRQIAKLTGSYKLLNLSTGFSNLTKFLFRVPQWPIGGIYFDGIMRTEHISRIKPTLYPVQTGVNLTDHAIIEPAELTIEVMMSDTETDTYASMDPILDAIYQSIQLIKMYSNVLSCQPTPTTILQGDGRAAATWKTLKVMQQSRVPITVETRLQTYENMLIEELSAPDDVKTLNAFRCTLRLREIIMADVAETKTSARAAATQQASTGGQTPASVLNNTNSTAAKVIKDKLGGGS